MGNSSIMTNKNGGTSKIIHKLINKKIYLEIKKAHIKNISQIH